jgi:hypothetical protein
MYERRTIGRVVENFQKFGCLFIFRVTEDDWNVEIPQTKFFCLRLFFRCPMFNRRPQVNDGLDAIGL